MSGRIENLRPPWKPGEAPNPAGINQYTYRADAEKHLDAWCRQYGKALVDKIANEAKAGKPWAAKLVLDRVLPAVTRHDVEAHVSGEVAITRDDEWASISGGVDRIRSSGRDVSTRKGNGSAASGDPP